jgi:hypothetical protein
VLRLSSKFDVTGRLRVGDKACREDEDSKEDEDDNLSHEGGIRQSGAYDDKPCSGGERVLRCVLNGQASQGTRVEMGGKVQVDSLRTVN